MSAATWEEMKKAYSDPNCMLDASDLEDVLYQAIQFEKALTEIAKAEGRYSMDQLTHASNTIEDMQAIAVAALNP
jgi:hypothetical protein